MARFITVSDLTGNTVIQAHVQASLLEPFIDIAQPMYILRVLATPLYEQLEATINTYGLTGVTGTNLTLLNKIKPALIYATFYESIPFLWAKITNKGITNKQSDNSTSVDKDDMLTLRANVNDWKGFYIEELKRFLRNNQATYTLWREEYFQDYEQYSGATYTRGSTGTRGGIILDRAPRYDQPYDGRLNKY
jgi:hypothetical protein